MQRQNIKTMIDRLLQIDVETYTKSDSDAVDIAIQMLEDLCNLVENLELKNAKLKQDILQLEAMIED